MKKLRSTFWDRSRELIEWCCDEELRVLRQLAGTEMEDRLNAQTSKFDQAEEVRNSHNKKIVKRKAMAVK